jgi:hypothetical protein
VQYLYFWLALSTLDIFWSSRTSKSLFSLLFLLLFALFITPRYLQSPIFPHSVYVVFPSLPACSNLFTCRMDPKFLCVHTAKGLKFSFVSCVCHPVSMPQYCIVVCRRFNHCSLSFQICTPGYCFINISAHCSICRTCKTWFAVFEPRSICKVNTCWPPAHVTPPDWYGNVTTA